MALWKAIRGRMPLTMPTGNASKSKRRNRRATEETVVCSSRDAESEIPNAQEERERREGECDYFLVEEVVRNIFDEPVLVTRRMKRKRNLPRRPDESSDVLGRLIAQHRSDNPQFAPSFVPGGGAIPPNAMLEVDPMPDDMSAMTPNTYFVESSNHSSANRDEVETAPAQTMQNYLDHSLPDLPTLREVAEQLVRAGSDAEAVDVVTEVLIVNNATLMSKDVAVFCLTTLMNIGGKSEATGKMISEGIALSAITETTQLYSGKSAEVHAKACEVLRSLSDCGCQQ